MLKCYFVGTVYENTGFAVVAESAAEAKQLGNSELMQDWVDIRAHIVKNVNIEGLSKGVIDMWDGLKRNAYAYVEDNCPVCGVIGMVYNYDGVLECSECEEKRLG